MAEISPVKIIHNDIGYSKMHVALRPLTFDDLPAFLTWAQDDEVTQFLMWDSYKTIEQARQFFETVVQHHPFFLAITYDGNVVGSITLDQGRGAHSCKAELGYVLAKAFWGRGITTSAVSLAITQGFSQMAIDRIEAYVDPTNKASYRVLEKTKFQREGLLRSYIVQKGTVRDRYVFSITRTELN